MLLNKLWRANMFGKGLILSQEEASALVILIVASSVVYQTMYNMEKERYCKNIDEPFTDQDELRERLKAAGLPADLILEIIND